MICLFDFCEVIFTLPARHKSGNWQTCPPEEHKKQKPKVLIKDEGDSSVITGCDKKSSLKSHDSQQFIYFHQRQRAREKIKQEIILQYEEISG
ncbi:hypothetical protein [Pseudenterobacter timonensis]|uniref:hypothetical protein n=1 Tax=Pseudenterobacter timonensis TaxID=1755099 RepID=UPI002877D61A|nr:hypothetical protein [Pseudenterobacter timonensis]